MEYYGCKDIVLSSEEIEQFYRVDLESPNLDLVVNEYGIIKDTDGNIIDKVVKRKDGSIEWPHYKAVNTSMAGRINPRNIYQECAFDMLQNPTSKVKLLRGVYGSGKDFLMLYHSLQLLEKGKFQKIVFIRPNHTVANVPDIGYLKGDVWEKLSWTLGPFYDKCGGEEGVKEMVARGQLELVPLPFIRGRSFDNSIIYVTEAQNTSVEIMKLLLSRVGDGSEIWLTADTHQTDKKIFDQDNGINRLVERLKGNPLFGYVYLPKTERGDVADLATLLE